MAKNKKEELGRGIRALLEGLDSDMSDEEKKEVAEKKLVGMINKIPLDQIEINPFQPRADFNAEKLSELAESIKIHGVIQPITVRRLNSSKYQLIAGERRLRAAKIAGLEEIPAYLRAADDQEMLEIALIENIQRENLNAVEIAINYKRLIDECQLTQEELGERVSKNRSTVTNYLRLLKLPPEIQQAIKERKLSMGHARALIAMEDVVQQLDAFKEILSKELSVRQAEQLVRNFSSGKKKPVKKEQQLPLAYQRVQDELSSHFSTKVNIKYNESGKGQIIINYYSDDDLNRILEELDS